MKSDNKKIFEAGGAEYGLAGSETETTPMKGINPDNLSANGERMITQRTAPAPIEKPAPEPASAPAPKPTPKSTPKPAPEPTGNPSGGLAALPWKQIAIVAGAAGLLAALIALLRKCTKSIKLRFNKSVRTLARMQKDFTVEKKGLDMRAVLPGVGSRLNDFITRAFSKSAFMNNGKTGIMGNTKSARKFKDGVIGLYPFCDIYKEEIRNDLTMAQTTFSKIKLAADTAGESGSNESFDGKTYNSFYEAFASDRLNESGEAQPLNEFAAMSLVALAPMVIRGGAFVVNKIKNGKSDPKDAKTIQVTKQSTREICYAIMNNFMEKYVSFEQVSKRMGVDIKGLSDIDASEIDKFGQVLKAYSNPDGASAVKQYARMKGAYDKMLEHYFNIGQGIIKNFEKYTEAKDEKHENLLMAAKEKLQAMWDQQKDQYEHLFPYVLNEIINDGAYQEYIDFIIEKVLPVFKSGIAGDADYVLDVMPKKGDYFLLRQTAQAGNIGNQVVCRITQDYNAEDKTIGMTLVTLYKGNVTAEADGKVTIDTDSENFDRKAYKKDAVTLPYNKFMALDPHQIANMEEVIKGDIRFDIGAYVGKDIIALEEGVQTFEKSLSEAQVSGATAVVYTVVKAEGTDMTYKIKYYSTDKDVKSKLRYDEKNNTYKANAEDFQAIPEESQKEGSVEIETLDGNNKPVIFTESVKNLNNNTKITFSVDQDNLTVQYEGFIERVNDKQVLHLKGTLNVEGEEKEKNDEKGRQSTVSKIVLLNIDGNAEGQEIIDYLTEKYGAKFEKQENSEFSDAIKKDEKTSGNMSKTQSRDIGDNDDIYTNVTELTDEIIDLYRQQVNKGDGASDINPFLMNYWLYTKINGAGFYFVPTMEDPSNKDKNPTLNGIIVKAESAKNKLDTYGKINVSGDAETIARQMEGLGAVIKKLSGDDLDTSRKISTMRKVKDTDVKATTEMPKNEEELKKFLESLFTTGTGKNRDKKDMAKYLFKLLVSVGDNINLEYDKNAKPKEENNQQNDTSANANANNANTNANNGGEAKGVQDTPSPTKEWDKEEVNSSAAADNSADSLNEDNVIKGHSDPKEIAKDLEYKDVKVTVQHDPSGEDEYDESKAEASGNKLTVTCGKLMYSDTEGNQQHVKFELEFCLSPLWKQGEYVPTAVIKNIYNNKSCSFPWTKNFNFNYVSTILLNSFDKMELYLGEEEKKEESLNDSIRESIKFTATYSVNENIEFAAFNTGINRKITADKNCSDYYVLSECAWSYGNDDAAKRSLASKVKNTLKLNSTKEALMEYAKSNAYAELSRDFADMSYSVKNPGNMRNIIGCSLYECAVAVKFNSKNVISNAIAIGVNKIK